MAVSFQLVIDCADPDRLARFWAAALGYDLEPPPAGFATWDDYWRDVGVADGDVHGDHADRGRVPAVRFRARRHRAHTPGQRRPPHLVSTC